MEKDKPQSHSGGFLSPSSRYPGLSPTGSSFNGKSEATSSSMTLPPMASGANSDSSQFSHGMSTNSNRFSHDICRMPDNPPRNIGHRRAHSEILTLPDDICFNSDLGVIGSADGPSFSDDTEEDLLSMYLDMDKFNSSSATSAIQVGESSAAVVDARSTPTSEIEAATSKDDAAVGLKERPRSAARSKERKMRYIAELERKVLTLQTEGTSLSAQLTLLQRDTNGLTAENSELKLRLQTMEQQVHLQDALNEALKEEIQHFKVLTGQSIPNGGSIINFASYGAGQQFYPNSQAMHTLLTAQQFQQLQIHSQQQQQQQQQHFQYHQMHQLQQQSTGDIKMKGSTSSPSPKDSNTSDTSSLTC
ncbi:putative transcription factor PosF21, partial [Cucurbita argyrosperma subsp. argyrosperma]